MKRNNGSFATVTDKLLRDTAALMAWRQANAGETCTDDLLFVLAAAERAIELGDNPAAFFVDIVKGNKRGLINASQDDRAATRLRQYHASGKRCQFVREHARRLAEKLSVGGRP